MHSHSASKMRTRSSSHAQALQQFGTDTASHFLTSSHAQPRSCKDTCVILKLRTGAREAWHKYSLTFSDFKPCTGA
eukprot:355423-Pelagomonas_calceolata.AAC.6